MKKVFIIAEAGVNHNGSIDIAKKLIDVAVQARCDCVKFQTFKAENVVTKYAQKAQYQKLTTEGSESQLDMIKKLELPYQSHYEIIEYCNKKNILFLSTPFDIESVEFLDSLGMSIFKIPSGEITNFPILRAIGATKKDVILSTGNSTIEEIEDAINVLKKYGTNKISLLHCNTEYPTPIEDVNLRAMITLKNKFNLDVGYSDHTNGFEVAIASVALGASIYEKHFTLDKTMEGPDHKASLEPHELIEIVKLIRNTEILLGSDKKTPSKSEIKNREIARKSIVAKKTIKKWDIFTEDNITTKRPATGISPMKWESIIGTTANKDYEEDEHI